METMIVLNKNGDVLIDVENFDPALYQLKPGEPVPESVAAKLGTVEPVEGEAFDRAAIETYLTLMGVAFEADATDKQLKKLKAKIEAKIANTGKQEV